jgi:hypothetical protein
MSKPIVVIVCMGRSYDRGSLNSARIRGTRGLVEEPSTASRKDIARLEAVLLSRLEHVHGKTIGVNLAIPISPKANHLIALHTFERSSMVLLSAAE